MSHFCCSFMWIVVTVFNFSCSGYCENRSYPRIIVVESPKCSLYAYRFCCLGCFLRFCCCGWFNRFRFLNHLCVSRKRTSCEVLHLHVKWIVLKTDDPFSNQLAGDRLDELVFAAPRQCHFDHLKIRVSLTVSLQTKTRVDDEQLLFAVRVVESLPIA